MLCTPTCHVCGNFSGFPNAIGVVSYVCGSSHYGNRATTSGTKGDDISSAGRGLAKWQSSLTVGKKTKYIQPRISQAKAAYDRVVANSTRTATRFMAAIPFPYFDPTSRTTHIGLACQGCKSKTFCQDGCYHQSSLASLGVLSRCVVRPLILASFDTTDFDPKD